MEICSISERGEEMPVYEFKCEDCGKTFDLLMKTGDYERVQQCPHCEGSKVKKIFSTFGVGQKSEGGGGCHNHDCGRG